MKATGKGIEKIRNFVHQKDIRRWGNKLKREYEDNLQITRLSDYELNGLKETLFLTHLLRFLHFIFILEKKKRKLIVIIFNFYNFNKNRVIQ